MDWLLAEYNAWWIGLSAIALVVNLLAVALFRKTWLNVTSLLHFLCVFLGVLNVIFGHDDGAVFSVPVLWINLVFLALNFGAWLLFLKFVPERQEKPKK